MHDTPLKQLFNQRGRAFSAGCVRVQDVFTLVEWIAKYENGWGQPGRAQDVVADGQPLDLTLTRPLPVYFTYITAWAEPNGRIVFRPDIYSRDGVRDTVASGERDPEDGPAPRRTLCALIATRVSTLACIALVQPRGFSRGVLTLVGDRCWPQRPRDLGRHLALVGLADREQLRFRERPADELYAIGQTAVARHRQRQRRQARGS